MYTTLVVFKRLIMADKHDINKAPIKWINTPFSYLQLGNKYTLLQQSVLLKVSEHLQGYVKEYYGSERSHGKEVPRPLFTDEQIKHGIGKFRIDLVELGVAPNNLFAAEKAAREALSVTLTAPPEVSDGKTKLKTYNVFSNVTREIGGSALVFELNMDMVSRAFDMSQGYISHPDDIAIIGKVEKMPPLYYILKKESKNWKKLPVRFTVFDLKDKLGMVYYNEDNTPSRILYDKFSQFKKSVLIPALNDIARLYDDGSLEVKLTADYIYPGKRTTGNPQYVQFSVEGGKTGRKKAVQQELFSSETTTQPVEPARRENEHAECWDVFVAQYKGPFSDFFKKAQYIGTSDGWPTIEFEDHSTYRAFEEYEQQHKDETKTMMAVFAKCFPAGLGVILRRGFKKY